MPEHLPMYVTLTGRFVHVWCPGTGTTACHAEGRSTTPVQPRAELAGDRYGARDPRGDGGPRLVSAENVQRYNRCRRCFGPPRAPAGLDGPDGSLQHITLGGRFVHLWHSGSGATVCRIRTNHPPRAETQADRRGEVDPQLYPACHIVSAENVEQYDRCRSCFDPMV